MAICAPLPISCYAEPLHPQAVVAGPLEHKQFDNIVCSASGITPPNSYVAWEAVTRIQM